MQQEWQTGTIVKIIDETESTRRFFIACDSNLAFDFKPGQFVTLDLPIHEKKNKRWRSYSIASAPDGSPVFELVIVLVEDGLGTNFLFKEMKEGDQLTFRGPVGVFVLHEKIPEDLFLICTGTGIAPFRSMIHDIKNHNKEFGNIFLIFGTRTKMDLLYHDEMQSISNEMEGFEYIPVLSRETWNGRQGYVHAVYEELSANKPAAEFMLCGWKNMIDEARQKLQLLNYDKKQIHFELYG
ncbi:MAG: ferredoxin--NADP reductase [Chitinophagaceae bacterium]